MQSTPNTKRSKLWLIVIIIIGGLVVVGGILLFLLVRGPGIDQKALGLSSAPLDQPQPVPVSSQIDTLENYCQIITPQLATSLGAVAEPTSLKGGIGACEITLAGNALVQISSVSPYHRLTRSNNPSFAVPVTVAGLEGRLYNLGAPLNGECTLNLNTRSLNTFQVNVRWYLSNDLERATKRDQSCQIAQKTAEVLAKAYVPLAGGAPYTKTLQRPRADVIGDKPCQVVGGSGALYAGVFDVADDTNGKQAQRESLAGTCVYEHNGNKASITLDKSGKKLADLPIQVQNSTVTDRQLGMLPARQATTGNSCSIAVELAAGILMDITYTSGSEDSACRQAEVMHAAAISTLVSLSSAKL